MIFHEQLCQSRIVTSGGLDVTYDFETVVPVTLQTFTVD